MIALNLLSRHARLQPNAASASEFHEVACLQVPNRSAQTCIITHAYLANMQC